MNGELYPLVLNVTSVLPSDPMKFLNEIRNST